MESSAQSLGQLEAARNLALGDGRYYPTIIPGVLPIISVSAGAPLEVQRWGADFLAETFASPTWQSDAKEASSLTVLPTLKDYMDVEDTGVVKSAVQAAASIYPLAYRHMYVVPFPHIYIEYPCSHACEPLNVSDALTHVCIVLLNATIWYRVLLLNVQSVSPTQTTPTTGSSCSLSNQTYCDGWTRPCPACASAASSLCSRSFWSRHRA